MALIKTIILFDGVCNLCNGTVDFILKRDKTKRFRMVPLQSDVGKELFKDFQIPSTCDSVIVIHRSDVYVASDAILKVCELLPAPWKWVTVFRIIPKGWRENLYRGVAKNRYRWFGKRTQCRVL